MTRLLVAVVVLLAMPAAAPAQGLAARVADELRSQRLYVHPDADPTLSPAQERELRAALRALDEPLYVAVLPERLAGGGPAARQRLLRRIAGLLDNDDSYAIAAGRHLQVGGFTLPFGRIGDLRDRAVDAGDGDLAATLEEFVALYAAEARSPGVRIDEPLPARDAGEVPGSFFLVLFAVALLGLFGLAAFGTVWRSRRRGRALVAADLELVRRAAREDVVALRDDIRALDAEVELPSASPAARDAYERALGHHARASAAVGAAVAGADVAVVTAALEAGRFAMEEARALLAGRPVPERRPPCFFDPRHGPSARDVQWTPPGGQPRAVPVCAADAVRLQAGEQPASREVVDRYGRSRPYWAAGPAYAGYGSGYFGGTEVLGGLALGTLAGGPPAGPAQAAGRPVPPA